MSDIKRYEHNQIEDIAIFSECKNGFYIKYDDHLAAIQQAKIELVREFVRYYQFEFTKHPEDLNPIETALDVFETMIKEQGE